MINLFAAVDGPHISLKAEEAFVVSGFSVTNSMIYGGIIAITALSSW
jgi:hypothetical protein